MQTYTNLLPWIKWKTKFSAWYPCHSRSVRRSFQPNHKVWKLSTFVLAVKTNTINQVSTVLHSIAWCVCGRMPWRKLPAYLVAQVPCFDCLFCVFLFVCAFVWRKLFAYLVALSHSGDQGWPFCWCWWFTGSKRCFDCLFCVACLFVCFVSFVCLFVCSIIFFFSSWAQRWQCCWCWWFTGNKRTTLDRPWALVLLVFQAW